VAIWRKGSDALAKESGAVKTYVTFVRPHILKYTNSLQPIYFYSAIAENEKLAYKHVCKNENPMKREGTEKF